MHANAQQWIVLLEGKLLGEKDLKIMAEGMSARLTIDVDQCQEEVRHLEKELGEMKASLLKESDKHNTLRIAIQLVCDDLELALA